MWLELFLYAAIYLDILPRQKSPRGKFRLISFRSSLKSGSMKALIPILTLCLLPVFANATEPDRDFYAGLYLTQPNIRLTASGLPQSELYATGFGFGFSLGSIIFDGIGLGLDADSRSFLIETDAQKNKMTNVTATFGSSWGRRVFGRFRIYGGAGIGPSFWFNQSSYDSGIGERAGKRRAKVDFTYQLKFGAAMFLTERFDLDFDLKLQNLGRSGSTGPDFSIIGDISLVEFRLGAAYKFGI